MWEPTRQNNGEGRCHREAGEIRNRRSYRGNGGSTHGTWTVRNKGSLSPWKGEEPNPTTNPRGPASAGSDGGWVRSTDEAGQCRWRELCASSSANWAW